MSQEAQNLLILMFATIFLGTFLGMWLIAMPEDVPLIKKWKALVRFGAKTKTPVLCGKHAAQIIKRGKMALLDNKNCELCNNKATLVR